MKNITPDLILWPAISLVFLLLVLGFDSAMDFQIRDTYYVIAILDIAFLFALILGILRGVYLLFKGYELNTLLIRIHAIGTSFCLIAIVFIGSFYNLFERDDLNLFNAMNFAVFILIAVFTLLQLVFIANIILGIRRPR